ncbi:hypothetical protein KKB55_03625 [Myxococcota bacterium]|nr:hypothetical protein [Myxococcota bacterium]MBU1896843.1 hypothetical protein [Myxococcota bacterium]
MRALLLTLLALPALAAPPALTPQTVEGVTIQTPTGWTLSVQKQPIFMLQMEARPGAADSPSLLAAVMPLSEGVGTTRAFIDELLKQAMPSHVALSDEAGPHGERLQILSGRVHDIPAKIAVFEMNQASQGIGFVGLFVAPDAEFDALGGAQLLFTVLGGMNQQGAAPPQATAPPQASAPITASGGPFTPPAAYARAQSPALSYLAVEGDALGPKEIESALSALNKDERLLLSLNPAFAQHLHRQACQLNPQYVLNLSEYSPPISCAQNLKMFMETLQFVGNDPNKALEQAINERNQLQMSWKCEVGQIDAQTCQTYYRTMMQMNDAHHRSMMRVITNMGGNSCIVGDPGCQPN